MENLVNERVWAGSKEAPTNVPGTMVSQGAACRISQELQTCSLCLRSLSANNLQVIWILRAFPGMFTSWPSPWD